MSTVVLVERTALTHRRCAPDCRRGGAHDRVGGRRAHRSDVAFARSVRCRAGRRAIEVGKQQVGSGVQRFGAGAHVGGVITRDPLDGVSGTTTVANPYHYSDNDPLNKTDPTGMRPCDAGFGTPSNSNDLRYDAQERPDPVPGAKNLYDEIRKQDRCLLFYDGRDDGMAGVVVGNLSAQHVMIELSATGDTLSNFTVLPRAASIQGGKSDFAVVAYLGYDAPGNLPGGIDAAGKDISDSTMNRLADLVHALKDRGKHVSILAHSWSAQLALRYDTQNSKNVDDLVLVGAFDVDSLAAWDFPSDREWQGLNDDDWIKSKKGLWSDWSEGTRRFSTAGSSGHDYWDGEAVDNIRRIGRGQFTEVLCAGGGDHCRWGF